MWQTRGGILSFFFFFSETVESTNPAAFYRRHPAKAPAKLLLFGSVAVFTENKTLVDSRVLLEIVAATYVVLQNGVFFLGLHQLWKRYSIPFSGVEKVTALIGTAGLYFFVAGAPNNYLRAWMLLYAAIGMVNGSIGIATVVAHLFILVAALYDTPVSEGLFADMARCIACLGMAAFTQAPAIADEILKGTRSMKKGRMFVNWAFYAVLALAGPYLSHHSETPTWDKNVTEWTVWQAAEAFSVIIMSLYHAWGISQMNRLPQRGYLETIDEPSAELLARLDPQEVAQRGKKPDDHIIKQKLKSPLDASESQISLSTKRMVENNFKTRSQCLEAVAREIGLRALGGKNLRRTVAVLISLANDALAEATGRLNKNKEQGDVAISAFYGLYAHLIGITNWAVERAHTQKGNVVLTLYDVTGRGETVSDAALRKARKAMASTYRTGGEGRDEGSGVSSDEDSTPLLEAAAEPGPSVNMVGAAAGVSAGFSVEGNELASSDEESDEEGVEGVSEEGGEEVGATSPSLV